MTSGTTGVPQCAPGVPGTPGGVVCPRPLGGLTTTTGVHTNPGGVPNQKRAHQTWLADRVETSRRAAKEQPCRKCGVSVLVGPDDDDCAITARVDLTPASLLEEVVARLNGRFSCELRRGRLYHRDDFRIRARRNDNPILLDHKCETTVLF